MPATKKTSKGVQAITESAKALFWKHGIRRVTVEEICKEAGVSKMTFYRNFSNKNEIAQHVLTKVVEHSTSRYEKIMNQDIAFPAKIVELVILEREESKGISQEFLKDIYQNEDSSLQSLIEQYQEEGRERIMRDMKKAQEKGWIRKDLKLSFLLYTLNDLDKKARDEELLAMYEKPEDLIMELTNFFFYGILP
ncbi:TetR/AcrR family transcriptional regulator [Lewinella cohaerens]|uniref:TetR/AcrR family transcriptional regulator n=1 Tax=Lewinella cohaerens TaxID=70995 RepID=UPI0003815967|nr:TetR/AcrR family transcriptional regulator [Lewinella cohaerens]